MWRKDEKGNTLSGARNAKRTLPNARRDIHRTTNSPGPRAVSES
jgi:hypothetical protein